MLKAYKYRIYPTEEQKFLMNKTFGCTRYVYNTCLYLRKWLREPDCQALNATILNMDKAYPHFFNHAVNHSYGFPKYKKRGGHQSFQCPGNTWEVNWEQSTLTIPKIADIPIVLSRPFEGKIKTVTISMTPTGKYFASILVDNERKLPGKPRVDENLTLGIDLGLKDFAITSSGLKIPAPRLLRQKIDRL
ncbi:MAG TPA: helix-turn-helix domain-containing protein, partial [Chitinophagaceae bacterium]|nr:helix-turn-helix domain-containing protein [Chitinophagaceae bacterium]